MITLDLVEDDPFQDLRFFNAIDYIFSYDDLVNPNQNYTLECCNQVTLSSSTVRLHGILRIENTSGNIKTTDVLNVDSHLNTKRVQEDTSTSETNYTLSTGDNGFIRIGDIRWDGRDGLHGSHCYQIIAH